MLLSGPPKSGKTFNAEMIIFNKHCSELFIPYKIDRIEDFEKYCDPNKKQIFLFDDAFGKHNIEFYRADTFDRKIEFILQLVDNNHKCIFTSREYIFRAFVEYSDKNVYINFINKIIVEVSNLSDGEKESVFRRYFTITFRNKKIIDEGSIREIITHKNFSPETIRAYFNNCNEFDLDNFFSHLNLPDKYLEKVFDNLTQEKRIVLLSVLFSAIEDKASISYSFNYICEDLKTSLLINLNNQLMLLEGSIIKSDNSKYYFYHPSMFDFFIQYLSKDIATYRNLLFKNININLLSIARFEIEKKINNNIKIDKTDISNLIIGFQRLIHNPSISLIEINSLLAWLESPDVLINFKLKLNTEFYDFVINLYEAFCSVNFYTFINEDVYHIDSFFHRINLFLLFVGKKIFISKSVFEDLLLKTRVNENYWIIVFSIAPFLDEGFIYKNVGRTWLNNFYIQLKNEIDSLGRELYGNPYPDFEEVARYKKLLEGKKIEEAMLVKNKSAADFKQKTSSNWYPRYKSCKEKMSKLKGSYPYGFKINQKLISNLEQLRLLEENQKNRYIFNKSKKWWK